MEYHVGPGRKYPEPLTSEDARKAMWMLAVFSAVAAFFWSTLGSGRWQDFAGGMVGVVGLTTLALSLIRAWEARRR